MTLAASMHCLILATRALWCLTADMYLISCLPACLLLLSNSLLLLSADTHTSLSVCLCVTGVSTAGDFKPTVGDLGDVLLRIEMYVSCVRSGGGEVLDISSFYKKGLIMMFAQAMCVKI